MPPRLHPNLYVVEKIHKHRVNEATLRVEFFVKWQGYTKDQNTWEPLDNIDSLPSLLEELEKKSHGTILKAAGEISKEAASSLPKFPVIPANILNKMKAGKDSLEFFPNGNEDMTRIVCELQTPETSHVLWKVYFAGCSSPRFVRKDLIAYYWPVEAALFSVHTRHKQESFKRFLETQENEKGSKKLKN